MGFWFFFDKNKKLIENLFMESEQNLFMEAEQPAAPPDATLLITSIV